jgi:hypothetical protein
MEQNFYKTILFLYVRNVPLGEVAAATLEKSLMCSRSFKATTSLRSTRLLRRNKLSKKFCFALLCLQRQRVEGPAGSPLQVQKLLVKKSARPLVAGSYL